MVLEIVSLANQGLLKMLMTVPSVMPLSKLRQVALFAQMEASAAGPPVKLVHPFARLVPVLLQTTVSSVDLARTRSMGHA
jgi:hypothetical protein